MRTSLIRRRHAIARKKVLQSLLLLKRQLFSARLHTLLRCHRSDQIDRASCKHNDCAMKLHVRRTLSIVATIGAAFCITWLILNRNRFHATDQSISLSQPTQIDDAPRKESNAQPRVSEHPRRGSPEIAP